MGRNRVRRSSAGDRGRGHGKGKKAPPGLRVKERDGFWHIIGRQRVGRGSVRVRRSTGLPARDDTWDAADTERRRVEKEIIDRVVNGVRPSIAVAVACRQYLGPERGLPAGHREAGAANDLIEAFPARILDHIENDEWVAFVRKRTAGNSLQSRERYIAALFSILGWCMAKPRYWLKQLPELERHPEVMKSKSRVRRRVVELTPDMIWLLIDSAAPHLGAQLAVEWSTGARVSSVLYGCRVCDLIIAPGNGAEIPNRSQIIFHETKNDEPVTAHLHEAVLPVLERYLEWRGKLRDREGPLFLTDRKKPYKDNNRAWGGQNKTAFRTARRRAARRLRQEAARRAWRLWRTGQRQAAWQAILDGRERAALLGKVTQHWFRHMLATTMLTKEGGLKAAMDQAGWLDPRSVLGYAHDVPDHRRQIVESLPLDAPVDTPAKPEKKNA